MKLSQFKFKFPEELIATEPTPVRDEARMMVCLLYTSDAADD